MNLRNGRRASTVPLASRVVPSTRIRLFAFPTDTYLHENALRAQANQLFGLAKVAAADAKRLREKRKGETIASGVAPAAKKGGSSASASSSAAAAN